MKKTHSDRSLIGEPWLVGAGRRVVGCWRWTTLPDRQRPKFRTLPVTRGDLFDRRRPPPGTVEPVEIIDVGAQIVGSIKSFGPDPDQPGKTIDYRSRVKQGDVLAQLDDLPHKAELDKAKANLQLAEAELKRVPRPAASRPNATSTAPRNCASTEFGGRVRERRGRIRDRQGRTGHGRGQGGAGEDRR